MGEGLKSASSCDNLCKASGYEGEGTEIDFGLKDSEGKECKCKSKGSGGVSDAGGGSFGDDDCAAESADTDCV